MLLNSDEVQSKLRSDAGRAADLAKDERPDAEKVAELFWSSFARAPTDSETRHRRLLRRGPRRPSEGGV